MACGSSTRCVTWWRSGPARRLARSSGCTCAAKTSRSVGQLHHGDEEVVDLAEHIHEPLEVDGLADVGVGRQGVTAQDVLFGLTFRRPLAVPADLGRPWAVAPLQPRCAWPVNRATDEFPPRPALHGYLTGRRLRRAPCTARQASA